MSAEKGLPADPCVCDPNGPCLGVPGDTIGCDACLALDPEEACIHDCDGSSECIATVHVHGCFADRDGARCNDPDDHAATVFPPGARDESAP